MPNCNIVVVIISSELLTDSEILLLTGIMYFNCFRGIIQIIAHTGFSVLKLIYYNCNTV